MESTKSTSIHQKHGTRFSKIAPYKLYNQFCFNFWQKCTVSGNVGGTVDSFERSQWITRCPLPAFICWRESFLCWTQPQRVGIGLFIVFFNSASILLRLQTRETSKAHHQLVFATCTGLMKLMLDCPIPVVAKVNNFSTSLHETLLETSLAVNRLME